MTFWKKLRLIGNLAALAVAVLVVCSALLLQPDAWQASPDPVPTPASPWNNGPGSNGL